jgi:hypothetical protein
MSSQHAIAEPPTEIVEPVSEDGRYVSEDEYWLNYYSELDIHYEWNDGRLEEKPVSDYATFLVYEWLAGLLRHFLKAHPIARLVALEMGFRLPLPHKTVIRKPDLGVVRNDNAQPLLPLDASYHGVFDLCIEALSDTKRRNIERDTVSKKAEYAAGGVREYYILHREPEQTAFFGLSPGDVYRPIPPVAGIVRSRVLPGFQFRASDLVRQPGDEAMRDDPVYAGFVLPKWRETEQRAEAAEQRARGAEQRAESAEQRAESAERRADAERKAREASEEELARMRRLLAGRNGTISR